MVGCERGQQQVKCSGLFLEHTVNVGLLTADEVTLSMTDATELEASAAADDTDEPASSRSSTARAVAA